MSIDDGIPADTDTQLSIEDHVVALDEMIKAGSLTPADAIARIGLLLEHYSNQGLALTGKQQEVLDEFQEKWKQQELD